MPNSDRVYPSQLEKAELEIRFLPIVCSAPLLYAHSHGFFEKNGLQVNLQPAPGWSGIKQLMVHDKVDAVHMLSPMPLSCCLGIDGKQADIRLTTIQNVNGQALTLAKVHEGIEEARDMKGFTFGVPYRFSMHYYLLCHFLAENGVNPLQDVTIKEVAPPRMPYYLEKGWVDGVFAPEPFNQIPVHRGLGFIYLLSRDVWAGHPCCSFATSQRFRDRYPNTYRAMLGSVLEAELAIHRANAEERRDIAREMCDPAHLDQPDPVPVEQALAGEFPDGKGEWHTVPDRIDFIPYSWPEYGSWMLSQMQRWGQLAGQVDYREIVESVFQTEETRELARTLGFEVEQGPRLEGVHPFTGDDPFSYMKGLPFAAFQEETPARKDHALSGSARQRLDEIVEYMAEVSGGNVERELAVTSDDELGLTERALREMVLNMKFVGEALAEQRDRLEERVRERTTELEREVAERREAEDALRLNESRLEALLRLNEMAEATFQETTGFALEQAVQLTNSELGYLAFTNEDESVLTMHAWSKTAMEQCDLLDKPLVYPVEETGLWGEAVRQRRPVITNDYAAPSPLKKGYPEGHVPVLRHLNVPLFDGDRIVAVAGVGNKPTDYDESDVRQLRLLMQGMWRLVQRQRAAEALQQAHDRLEARVEERTAELSRANQSLRDEIAERERAEERLGHERGLMRALMENTPDNIYFKDVESRFLRVSRSMAGWFGLDDPQQAEGKTDRDFFTEEHAQQALADERRLMESGEPLVGAEEKETWPDGRETWVSTTKAPLRDARGQVVGTFGISRDITALKQAEEELQQTLAELARSNTELEQFAYVASHDLQEPLRKIHAFGERLRATCEGGLDERAQDYLDRMLNAVLRMQTLINDLLTYSRVTTRAQPFASVALDQVVAEVVADLEMRVERTGGRVEMGELPTLAADPTQMRQLFQNLIDNGLKFHQPGRPPIVKVNAERLDGQYQITVEDNGIGFDEKHGERIFAMFQRLHSRMDYEGTGVGLAVCRKIAERHGGTITARSVPGQGTAFLVTLPVRQPEAHGT